jgi:segregation and condensation protein B
MEEHMRQQPGEVSAEIDDEPQTDSETLDPEDQEQQIEQQAVVEDVAETQPEAFDEDEATDLDANEPVDENSDTDEGEDTETIEVEFSVEGIGETETQEENAETHQDEATEAPAESEEETPTIESVIEAVLFASDEPLTDSRLAGIVETTAKQVRDCIEALNAKYEQNHNAFRIDQIAGGNQMLTMSVYNNWLKKMLRVRSDSKLSPAAMETLAIIAYKQPVIRADIEAIRGVAVGEVIRSLMYKGLVKIVGRAEILGRPMLYGTTKKFLEVFGLNSLKDLPKAEELKKPD